MLQGLDELESLWIKECDVSEAGEIVKLKNLKSLRIEDTLLAGNQEQIELIFENCPNLESVGLLWEDGGLNSLKFLKDREKLESLILKNQSGLDYSIISQCSNLKQLSLRGCDISDLSILNSLENLENLGLSDTNVSEVKDILKLKKLKYLFIDNTPLAEDEEQLALIYQKFPDIELTK